MPSFSPFELIDFQPTLTLPLLRMFIDILLPPATNRHKVWTPARLQRTTLRILANLAGWISLPANSNHSVIYEQSATQQVMAECRYAIKWAIRKPWLRWPIRASQNRNNIFRCCHEEEETRTRAQSVMSLRNKVRAYVISKLELTWSLCCSSNTLKSNPYHGIVYS